MAGKRVFIVDDEGHITYLLSMKLGQLGYDVTTAGDGEEAYLLACQSPPDLIVTDFQMPVMSGYEMCVKLRETPATAEVPVIMLTARGHCIPPSDLLKTNIQALMAKPFALHELIARVTDQIGLAASPEQTPASPASPIRGA